MDLEARESDGVDAGAAELSFRLNKIRVMLLLTIVGRELGLAAVVGTEHGTESLQGGQ